MVAQYNTQEGGMDILVMLEENPDHSPVLAHVNSVPSPLHSHERPSRDIVTLYGDPNPESLALALAAAVESHRADEGYFRGNQAPRRLAGEGSNRGRGVAGFDGPARDHGSRDFARHVTHDSQSTAVGMRSVDSQVGRGSLDAGLAGRCSTGNQHLDRTDHGDHVAGLRTGRRMDGTTPRSGRVGIRNRGRLAGT